MASYVGRNAAFKVGGTTVAEISDWSISMTADIIRADVFGNTWARKHGTAATDWTATVNGLVDITDTSGQTVLQDALIASTKIGNLRFYIDATNYYTSTSGTDADAGAYITEYSPGTAQGDVARVSISIEGTGPVGITT